MDLNYPTFKYLHIVQQGIQLRDSWLSVALNKLLYAGEVFSRPCSPERTNMVLTQLPST